MIVLKLNKLGIFHPLKVVGRGSETQLQVDENLNYSIQQFNPLTAKLFNLNFHPLEVVSR